MDKGQQRDMKQTPADAVGLAPVPAATVPLAHPDAAIRLLRLTDRQRELLSLISGGVETSKALSRETGLSPATIDNHLSRAARVLGAANRKEAARVYDELSRLAPRLGVEPPATAHTTEQEDGKPRGLFAQVIAVLRGPPVGGAEPPVGWRALSMEVLRVAFVGLFALSALTLFVLAFFKTFG
jgi:DNA-binding CsgD family transcriptional regulator